MMKKFICSLLALLPIALLAQNTAVRINEVDPDQPGTDTKEFVELFGPANASLDGLVLVFFNGVSGGNTMYSLVDLAGYSLDSQGFFLVATQPLLDSLGASGAVLPTLQGQGDIQNGQDAIALYAGSAADWPAASPAVANNLIDAIVYGTDDPDATGLLPVLTPDQIQLNDSGNSPNSFSRLPDGGAALNLASFVVQAPTPGATNGEPVACLAGVLTNLTDVNSICIETLPEVISISMSGAIGNVIYALTSGDQVVDTSSSGVFVSGGLELGDYQLWGIAYTDNLVLEPGLAVASIGADCLSFSEPIAFTVQDCLPNCLGGTLSWSADTSAFCLDALPADLNLSIIGGLGSSLFIVSQNGIIVSSSNGTLNLSNYASGTYQITAVSFDGNLLETSLLPGSDVNAIAGDGCIAFSTSIDFTIIDCSIPCQILSFENDTLDVCVEDENSQITWNAIGTGSIFYILTNDGDNVITVVEDSLDYSILAPGIYKVFAAAYADILPVVNAGVGIFSITSDQCFDIYEDPIVIHVNDCFAPCQIDGFNTSATNSVFCVEDGAVEIQLSAFPNAQGSVRYFLTDANGIILGSSPNQLSTAGLPEGDYLVVAVAYLGELAADSLLIGSLVDTLNLSSTNSCFTFAPGPFSFSIEDCYPNCLAEEISVLGALSQCDQINYPALEFNADSLFGSLAVYRTDASGSIIEALESANFDANEMASGTYYFQVIAYSGVLDVSTIQPGNAVSAILSSDCVSFYDSTFTLIINPCELTTPCSELFFSEYLEGSSFNKAIEIYNPTPFAVDLAAYKVEGYNNGVDSSASNTLALTGILESGDVYVIANGQASPGILAIADTTSSVANFNGDDAIVLVHDGAPVDIIGIVGEDPGANWSIVGGATSNNTLVRNPDFTSATTDWLLLQTQWTVYPQDDTTHLGSHETVGCTVGPDPCVVSFTYTATDSSVSLQIAANELNQSFQIEWGDGSTGDQNDLTHVYEVAGYYEVCISAADSACEFQYCESVGVGIECAMDVVITENDPLVSVSATELATGSGNFIITWGIGEPSFTENASFEYTESGNYQVCVSYTDTVYPQCAISECYLVSVVVPSTCVAELTVIPGINPGEYQVIVNGSGAMDPVYSIQWGDGFTDNTMSASHIYGPGIFDITATYGDADVGGCFVELGPETVVIESNCFAFMEIVNAGNIVNVTPSSSGFGVPVYTINWGDGSVSEPINIDEDIWHEYATSGTYTITLNVIDLDPSGCALDINETLTINEISGNCPVQLETSLNLSNVVADAFGPLDGTYIFSWGDGSYFIGSSAQHFYEYPDTFNLCVSYTSADGQCSSVSCNEVVVTEVSSCQVEIVDVTTQGLSATLILNTLNSLNTLYIIEWGDGIVDSTYNDFHIYDAPGTYVVTVTIFDLDDPLCYWQDQINVTVEEIVTFCTVTLTVTPQQDGSFLAEAIGEGATLPVYSITWGDGSVPEQSNSAIHSYAESGNYQICVTYSDLNDFVTCYVTECEYITGMNENVSSHLGAQVFPNPLQGNSVLEINSATSGFISVELLDAMGRKVSSVFNGDIIPGQSRYSLPTEKLLPGIYTVLVRSDVGISSITVVKH